MYSAPEYTRLSPPTILITGTPCSGKTSLSEEFCRHSGFVHLNVSKLVEPHHLHDGYNSEYQCYDLNEDKTVDYLEDRLSLSTRANLGAVVEFHGSAFFPQRWFDLVVVLRCDTEPLYDRLQSRGYSLNKVNENMESEIMQVCLDEAMESYDEDIVAVRTSSTVEEQEQNVEFLMEWTQKWYERKKKEKEGNGGNEMDDDMKK